MRRDRVPNPKPQRVPSIRPTRNAVSIEFHEARDGTMFRVLNIECKDKHLMPVLSEKAHAIVKAGML